MYLIEYQPPTAVNRWAAQAAHPAHGREGHTAEL